MKITFLILEKNEDDKFFRETLKKIKFKGNFEPENMDLDFENAIVIEVFDIDFVSKDEKFKDFSKKAHTRLEFISVDYNDESVHYRRYGKNGNILSDKFPKDYEFNENEKENLKTKIYFPKIKKIILEDMTGDKDKDEMITARNEKKVIEQKNYLIDKAYHVLNYVLIRKIDFLT